MNRFLKIFLIVACIIFTSFYYFPFIFKALPILNTKQFAAMMGVLVLGIRLSEGKGPGNGFVQADFLKMTIYAGLVSLAGLFSVIINNTPDYSYATYIMSFFVWIAGAYAVYSFISYVHGKCAIPHMVNYLTAVCVIQCVLAIWIDMSPGLKEFVDAHVEQGQDFLNARNVKRLYGIGASLDTAGIRFSIVEILIATSIFDIQNTKLQRYTNLYFFAFAIIIALGNMVARTTIVGAGIGLAYIMYNSWEKGFQISPKAKRIWKWIVIATLIAVPIAIYYYNNNETIHKNIRFAFEGFFNYVETGTWSTTSTTRLETMYVWPDNWKTWIMGDGYFVDPTLTDPYFSGRFEGGYYMGTDVGYCRFIFYFGIVGLSLFSLYLWNVCQICFTRFKGTKFIFLMILLCNFVIWLKVSTDVFLAFALFLCIGAEENEEYMKSIALKDEVEETVTV